MSGPSKLIAPDEPSPVTVTNVGGKSPYLILADHAGNYIPRSLQRLGISAADSERHICWDIGAGAVCEQLAIALDAVLIRQNFSRLVIDCNRPPRSESSIVELSEHTQVPGNIGIDEAQIESRIEQVFQPYHETIGQELDRRQQKKRPTVLVAMHSFTPAFKGIVRPWHAGVLYNRNPHFAHIVLDLLRSRESLIIGDNEPYSVDDTSDYTIPVHGEQRHLDHVAIEIRQDLISDAAGQRTWARLLEDLLPVAYRKLGA